MPPVAWGFTFTNLEIVFKKTVSLKKKKKEERKGGKIKIKKTRVVAAACSRPPLPSL